MLLARLLIAMRLFPICTQGWVCDWIGPHFLHRVLQAFGGSITTGRHLTLFLTTVTTVKQDDLGGTGVPNWQTGCWSKDRNGLQASYQPRYSTALGSTQAEWSRHVS